MPDAPHLAARTRRAAAAALLVFSCLAAASTTSAGPGPAGAAAPAAWLAAPPPPSAADVCAAVPTAPATTRECACTGGAPCRRCTLDLTLPIWIPGVSGSFASGTTEVDVDRPDHAFVTKPDIALKLEFALVGRVDVRRDRWVGFVDVFGVTLEETVDFRRADQDVVASTSAFVGRAMAGYRILPSRASCGCGPWDIDLLAGVRMYWVDIELREPVALAFDKSRTWVDPLFGVRARYDLPGPVDLRVLADLGGFGVGSDLSWSFAIEAEWCLSRHFSLQLGYTWLSIQTDLDEAADRFRFDLELRGPHLALTYRF